MYGVTNRRKPEDDAGRRHSLGRGERPADGIRSGAPARPTRRRFVDASGSGLPGRLTGALGSATSEDYADSGAWAWSFGRGLRAAALGGAGHGPRPCRALAPWLRRGSLRRGRLRRSSSRPVLAVGLGRGRLGGGLCAGRRRLGRCRGGRRCGRRGLGAGGLAEGGACLAGGGLGALGLDGLAGGDAGLRGLRPPRPCRWTSRRGPRSRRPRHRWRR